MPKRMFGTAGIRGVTNAEITPDLALRISAIYGEWMAERKKGRVQAGVGHDTRYGAAMLAQAAAAGLASAGCEVHAYGCVSTGVFSMNLARSEFDGGILITGSHMPPDRIGIIAMLGDGAYAPLEITDVLEERFRSSAPRRAVRPENIGPINDSFHPYELYVSETVKQVDARLVKSKGFRILVDPANGTASYIAKELFQWFGCDVELINYDPSPVPGRPSEPRANTVGEAIECVKRLRCDLGLCVDVDADRALFITHQGDPVSEDTVGALFAKEELKPGDVCVVPINSSGLIERVCEEIGARLEYCEVGQPPTVAAIKRLGAAYSYEESGKYYFARQNLWCDGLFSGAKMLEIMARRGKSLEELVSAFPRFHQVKKTIHVEDAKKDAVMAAATERLSRTLLDGRTRDLTIDGFKRCYRDHAWLLVRKSGTEPIIRVYSDAPSLERAEQLVAEGVKVVDEAVRSV